MLTTTSFKKGKDHSSFKHGMTNTTFHRRWMSMNDRCKPAFKDRRYYFDKGIVTSPEWKDFLNFKADMYESFLKHVEAHGEKDTTLERIDSNGNYCKENCKWATRLEQGRNTSRNIVYKGESAKDAAARLGGCRGLVAVRITNYGWSKEDAFMTPLQRQGKKLKSISDKK